MKVLVGHFGHEANTFAENNIGYDDFIGRGIWRGSYGKSGIILTPKC
jgi:microcystin degradation protein MlrC